jgi:hypothetical protein
MSAPLRNGTGLLVTLMLVAAAFALLEVAGLTDGRGAFLVTLALWTAIAQGTVAASAAADVAGARWIAAVRPKLLVGARLQPFLALLFLLLWPRLGLYPWAAEPGAWLNPGFFVGRNLALLSATALLARLYAARASRADPTTRPFAVAYLALFFVTQTIVAFDWFMSLSYPWVSSMFAFYFPVEAFYAGLALAGLLFVAQGRGAEARDGARWSAAGRDLGFLLFGFSVLWIGLFFAQFMLIWYGNLPEEVSFIVIRLGDPRTRALMPVFITACWVVPFFGLLSAAAKRRPRLVAAASASVLVGLLAERLLLVLPTLPVGAGVLGVELVLMAGVWFVASTRADDPAGSGAEGAGTPGGAE